MGIVLIFSLFKAGIESSSTVPLSGRRSDVRTINLKQKNVNVISSVVKFFIFVILGRVVKNVVKLFQVLSVVVTCFQVLSNVVKCCQMLSSIV